MKTTLSIILFTILIFTWGCNSNQAPRTNNEIITKAGNYKAFAPSNAKENAPLVVALHGCFQSVDAYEAATGWSTLAEQYGFYVLYPSNNNNCWTNKFAGGYSQAELDRVLSNIDEMKNIYPKIDNSQIYVTGLSAGTGLANCLLVKKPNLFAGGAPMSGAACTQSGNPNPNAKIILWQTTADFFSNEIDETYRSYGSNSGGTETITNTKLKEGTTKQHSYSAFTKNGNAIIGLVELDGMGHGTACDPGTGEDQGGCEPGSNFSSDWDIHSTYYSAKFWGILSSSNEDQKPTVQIISPTATINPGIVTINANANDDKGITKVEFYVNENKLGEDTTAPYSISWNATIGLNTLKAISFDTKSQPSSPSIVNINVKEEEDHFPTVTITSPQNGDSFANSEIIVNIDAIDDKGISKVELYVNNNKVAEKTTIPYNIAINLGQPGNYSLKAIAYDTIGQNSESQNISISLVTGPLCKDFTATNYEHVDAGRAESYTSGWFTNARTIGAGDDLGSLGSNWYSTTTTVKETSTGFFAKGSCDNGGGEGEAFTATLDEHVAAGRTEKKYGMLYYAKGSNQYLGTDGSDSITLIEESTGVYKKQ